VKYNLTNEIGFHSINFADCLLYLAATTGCLKMQLQIEKQKIKNEGKSKSDATASNDLKHNTNGSSDHSAKRTIRRS
jgi:hypothetical protein